MNAVTTTMPAVSKPRVRVQAWSSGGRRSYSGADATAGNIRLWRPPLKSADADILRDAEKLRARARDLVRNHPYARQAVRCSRLGVIGKKLRYSCRPDHRFLGIDQEDALRWAQEWERVWDNYAHSTRFHVDAGRRLNFTGLMALIHDAEFVDGEALLAAEWDPRRTWKSCFQIVDVDRLSNPNGAPETDTRRAGVELGPYGEPVGYHIRNRHPADYGVDTLQKAMNWQFIPRETAWGRFNMAHSFEQSRAAQTRGVTEFASVMSAMKMGAEYMTTALESMILQASYAAVLQSQANHKEAMELIDGMVPDENGTLPSAADLALDTMNAAQEWYEAIALRFNGAKIPQIWPGEEFKLLTPGNHAPALNEFNKGVTKEYAAGTGTNPVSVSQDYSDVNYSSAKMAQADNWRHYEARRERLIESHAMQMVASVFEEAVFSGAMWLPKGVSPADFYDARDALIKGKFLTQGAPNLDPLKEIQALQMELDSNMTTMQDALASRGEDLVEVLDQIALERMLKEERGIFPAWSQPAVAGEDTAGADDPADDGDDPPATED